jgi:carboxyl-terminal processing protease
MRALSRVLVLLAGLAALSAAAAEPPDAVAELLAAVRRHALLPPPPGLEAGSVEELVGRLRALDPHMELLPPAAAVGRGGLGLRLGTLGRPLVMPVAGGAAAAAGLRDPAYLEQVEGVPVAGLDATAIARLLSGRGPVELGLAAGPDGRSVRLRLAPGEPPPLAVELLPGRAATLVRIHEFEAERTAAELARALGQGGAGPLVLDLRLNPGGALFEALDAASLLVPAGALLARVEERQGGPVEIRAVARRPARLDLPVVLLVGEQTASAAEAFARALVHHRRAVAVGRPTRGKCRAQRELPLAGGRRLRLTTTALAGPDGLDCEGRPLRPALEVDPLALLDTDGLVARALGLLGTAERPTALCLREALPSGRAALLAEELALLFPSLPAPVLLAEGPAGARRCLGPLADPALAPAWRRRLEAGLEAAVPPVAVEALPYGRLLTRAP